MTLPLLTRAIEGDTSFVHLSTRGSATNGADAAALVPARRPGAGEQYRFHFDMSRCIGCKCCVVACNEQNGNPAAVNWRRVGEIEGGWFPQTTRAYLSMGCNHCADPTCLTGCPVDAYTKDPATGIVRHSADACIGCQYCTWNCSYGVPQYNPERGVVGKCDMCHGRLALGQAPACVSACPEGAIQIEIVSVDQWRRAYDAHVPGRGVPAGDHSVSMTRVTLPADLPPTARPVNVLNVRPEQPHWPLVVMTVLTQLAVGAFATIWMLQLLGTARLGSAALIALLVAVLALTASTLHLGRPVHAYRALMMWRRSWLSREVLLFTAFAAVACAYAVALWFRAAASPFIGGLTVLLGIAGVTASACIYRVPSRPSWNTPYTLLQFNLTAGVLGPPLIVALGASADRWVQIAAAIASAAQLVLLALRFLRFAAAASIELQGTARLLSTTLKAHVIARVLLLGVGGALIPLIASPAWAWTALPLVLAGELLGRYLFFVSAVAKHMAAPYLELGSEAA